jgi:two-component system CheB/CheR fusion protein
VAFAASAGGLSALSQVLSILPPDFATPILVVQHLDPEHRSWMAEILARRSGLRVEQVRGGERLAAGGVHVAPPGQHLLVAVDGALSLSDTARVKFSRPSADVLFASLAASWGRGAIAVVLTGTGSDGADGVRAIKSHGGTVIHRRVPGGADLRRPCVSITDTEPEMADPASASDFVKLLDYLKATRGFDFSGYKLSSLIRRVRKRMQLVGIASYGEYVDFLEVHPDEFQPLFNTVLINVTAFFRDPQAWKVLADQILPRLLEDKAVDESLRCWSAGCASGEEAYTLAMLLAEAMGEAEFRQRVKIYATDVDEEALAQGRQGTYTSAQINDIPQGFLKYFEPVGDRFIFRPDLRRSIIFGRHDLLQDAAISRLDLLVCRNTLMYFNVEAQARILARFHFALACSPSPRPPSPRTAMGTGRRAPARPPSTPVRWRRSPSTAAATSCWPTRRPASSSTSPPPTSAACCRTSRSPTGRSSCAPTSTPPSSPGRR